MSTPVETIADALISFILSLLRDPAAVEEFNAAPQAAMAAKGLQGVCADDVKAVAPVIIDHPSVGPSPKPPYHPEPPDPVVKEIHRILNQFTTVDNRTTLVDQSTNQNIWTNGGDVTQIFDQEAIIASGDGSIAAGDDANVDESDTDITVGDIAVGNNTNSHNNDVDVTDGAVLIVDGGPPPVTLEEGMDQAADAAAAAIAPAEPPAPEPEPEPLMTDMTATDGYDSSEPLTPPEPEPYLEEPAEET